MQIRFQTKFLSFVIPEGFEVKPTSEASCCLSCNKGSINLVINDRMSYEMALREVEQKYTSFKSGESNGWNVEATEKKEGTFGNNYCHYLENRLRFKRKTSCEVDVVLAAPTGWCHIQYYGEDPLSAENLQLLLSTLELHDPVPETISSASDRRKWNQALIKSLQTANEDKVSDE